MCKKFKRESTVELRFIALHQTIASYEWAWPLVPGRNQIEAPRQIVNILDGLHSCLASLPMKIVEQVKVIEVEGNWDLQIRLLP